METHGTTREESITMAAIQSINKKLPDLELRDIFALHIIGGLASQQWIENVFEDHTAELAYSLADAMIEAREKKIKNKECL